ncbi:MAG: helix-turn-helix domain-containing protein [Methanosarcina sp.]
MDGRRADKEAAERIGKNLWRARRRAGFSQEELGALCSLHRTEIGHLEQGRRIPRVDTLMKIATTLEVGVEHLLRGIEWIPPSPRASGSFAVQAEPGRG